MDGASVFITIQKVYYPLLCTLGIPANLFTFYMICFRKCGMSETAIVYLSFLAIVDIFYLVWVILLDLTLTFLQETPFWHSHPWCALLNFLQYGSLYSSSWIVVVFAIERYLALSVTAAKQHFSKVQPTVLTCTAIVLVSHLVSIPMCWISTVTLVNMTIPGGQNITASRCHYRDATYSTVVVWLSAFLSGGIPIILVVIFNSLIASHLTRAGRLFTKEERQTMKGVISRRVMRRTVLLLGTVSVTFMVLSLPRFVTYCILRTAYNHEDFDRNDYRLPINVVSDLANMLQNLNSTTNFLLYCVVSRRFRQEAVRLMTCSTRVRDMGSFLTQTTMKVFSVVEHKSASSRDNVRVILTSLKKTGYTADSGASGEPSLNSKGTCK
ncbi:putative G-protein coupled receptor 139 [Arapaima gigas]